MDRATGYRESSAPFPRAVSTPVNLNALLDAYQFVSMAGPYQNEAFICLTSGKIYWRSELLDEEDQELPHDLDNEEKYIRVPEARARSRQAAGTRFHA